MWKPKVQTAFLTNADHGQDRLALIGSVSELDG
jgi:hypothetical protein